MTEQPAAHTVIPLAWEGEGYKPVVIGGDWLVALMNWELRFDPSAVGKIERHNETAEVFVLLQGKSVLFIKNEAGIHVEDMIPGIVYHVTRGTWHSVIGSRDAAWLIVEAKNTSVENSDYAILSPEEKKGLCEQYPTWLKEYPEIMIDN